MGEAEVYVCECVREGGERGGEERGGWGLRIGVIVCVKKERGVGKES